MNKKKILAPWVLVVIGIAFNIFAAVITHYFIGLNNTKLDQLEDRTQKIETRINSYWQDRQNIERKMEFILLLQQQGKQRLSQEQEPFVLRHIEKFIQGVVTRYKVYPAKFKKPGAQQIIQIVQQAQEKIINDIDEVYFDKLILEKEKMLINNINSRLMSIALFLQLLGLILVLAKDFQRQN